MPDLPFSLAAPVLTPVRLSLAAATSLIRVAVTLVRHTGEAGARRNAWTAMVEGATRARARREADVAVADSQRGAPRATPEEPGRAAAPGG